MVLDERNRKWRDRLKKKKKSTAKLSMQSHLYGLYIPEGILMCNKILQLFVQFRTLSGFLFSI